MSINPNSSPAMSVNGSTIKVPTDIADAGPQIMQRATTIVDELDALYSQINTLQADWIGNASASYQALQAEWNTAAQGLFGGNGAPGVLGEIAQAMNIVAANYGDAESANIKTWNHS